MNKVKLAICKACLTIHHDIGLDEGCVPGCDGELYETIELTAKSPFPGFMNVDFFNGHFSVGGGK